MSTRPLLSGESSAADSTSASAATSLRGSMHVSGSSTRLKPKRWYLEYYIPSLQWLSNYSWKSFPGDVAAGLTLTSFQIPVSLSYATSLAGVPAISGLYGLIVPPFIYAVLGTVPPMVVAPEGPISLIMGKAVSQYIDNPGHRHGRSNLTAEQVAGTIAGSAGGIVLAMGLLRVGFLGSVLSQSMLRGFVTGVGLVMLADQLPAQLGLNDEMRAMLGHDASSYQKVQFIAQNWRLLDPITTLFSMLGLVAIVSMKSIKKMLIRRGFKRAILIPEILLVVIASTIICDWGNYNEKGVDVVGKVTPGRLEVHWMLRPKFWNDFRINFETSAFISVLGILESTVAARMMGTGDSASSANRELVALGAANVLGGLFGALPSFGGYGRSKINLLSGATTQMSAIIISVTTIIVTYSLMGYLFYLPKCTLSSVIASVGLTLIEEAPREIEYFYKVRSYSDLTTIVMSLLVTFFWSVEAGVVAGGSVALIRLIHHATRPRIQILTRKPGTQQFVNADDMPDMPAGTYDLDSGILVVKIPEPLTFANSVVLEERLRRLERHRTTKVHPALPPHPERERLHIVIFHLKGMTELDATAALILKTIIESYLTRHIRIIFTELVPRHDLMEILSKAGIFESLESQPRPSFYTTVEDAIHDASDAV